MRNWERFAKRVEDLYGDIYAQPEDPGHTAWGINAINSLMVYAPDAKSVLDVGCGQGPFRETFKRLGKHWVGVTLGPDFGVCQERGLQVYEVDMSDLPFPDEHYDMVFARHVLEHSPFPILTLMEWRRVACKYLLLIAPTPDHWGAVGKNHYSVAPEAQLEWWLARAGWAVKKREYLTTTEDSFLIYWREAFKNASSPVPKEEPPEHQVEYRFLCEKADPKRE